MARPEVILFDVNETLLDMQPIKDSIGKLLGGGPEAARLWFTTMLQYSQATTLADRYTDFAEIGAACLRMEAKNHGIELDEKAAKLAIAPMRSLPPHGDAIAALKRLRDANYRLVALTNSSKSAVEEQMKNAKLSTYFESLLSVETVELYKPHGHVYRWAARQVGADVFQCLLVAAHGWDVAGAAWAGMRTAFVARPGQQMYPLGPALDLVLSSLTELPEAIEKLK